MHFDGWNTIEGRHLVFAYTSIFLIQGGYFLWMIRSWLKLGQEKEKAARSVN